MEQPIIDPGPLHHNYIEYVCENNTNYKRYYMEQTTFCIAGQAHYSLNRFWDLVFWISNNNYGIGMGIGWMDGYLVGL